MPRSLNYHYWISCFLFIHLLFLCIPCSVHLLRAQQCGICLLCTKCLSLFVWNFRFGLCLTCKSLLIQDGYFYHLYYMPSVFIHIQNLFHVLNSVLAYVKENYVLWLNLLHSLHMLLTCNIIQGTGDWVLAGYISGRIFCL